MIDGGAGGEVVVVVVAGVVVVVVTAGMVVVVVEDEIVVDVVVEVVVRGTVVEVVVEVVVVVGASVVVVGNGGEVVVVDDDDVVDGGLELELVGGLVDDVLHDELVGAAIDTDGVGAVAVVVGPVRESEMVDVVVPFGHDLVIRQRTFRVVGLMQTENVFAVVLTVADTVRDGHSPVREYRSVRSLATHITLGAATEMASLVSLVPHVPERLSDMTTADFETQNRETGAARATCRFHPADIRATTTNAIPHAVPVSRQRPPEMVPIVRPPA